MAGRRLPQTRILTCGGEASATDRVFDLWQGERLPQTGIPDRKRAAGAQIHGPLFVVSRGTTHAERRSLPVSWNDPAQLCALSIMRPARAPLARRCAILSAMAMTERSASSRAGARERAPLAGRRLRRLTRGVHSSSRDLNGAAHSRREAVRPTTRGLRVGCSDIKTERSTEVVPRIFRPWALRTRAARGGFRLEKGLVHGNARRPQGH